MARITAVDNSSIIDTGLVRRCAAAVSGSFGLVSVAPFTALCAGLMLTKRR